MSEFSVSEAALAIQVEIILRDFCPISGSEEICKFFVLDWWKLIAQQFWPEAWSHLCDDSPCGESDAHLECDDCELSLIVILFYLRLDNIVDYWKDKLGGSFCSDNYPDPDQEGLCKYLLEDVFPLLVNMLTDAEANRSWIVEFCTVDIECIQ